VAEAANRPQWQDSGMRSRLHSCLLGAVAATAVSCSTPWALRNDDPDGSPSRQFPRDRVSMWELAIAGERLLPVARSRTPERIGDYMLVVAFDERGQVAQWSLVLQWTQRKVPR